MYGYQHKMIRKGVKLPWHIAVDYKERHAGSSLTHFVSTADDVFEQDGRLAYKTNNQVHFLGCIIHAPGQSGSLIEENIQLKVLANHRAFFMASNQKRVEMHTSFAKLRIQ